MKIRPVYRLIEENDLDELLILRSRTRENAISVTVLHDMGINRESTALRLRSGYRGWLCEDDGVRVGFAIGNGATGELWVIAVDPEFEGQGIGRTLLYLVMNWLLESRDDLWLLTHNDVYSRAYQFYLKAGWIPGVSHGMDIRFDYHRTGSD